MSVLEDMVAIVTGAGTGIGRAAALTLAEEGAAVVIADIDVARGVDVVGEIEHKGGRALFVETDVTDDAQVAHAVRRAIDEFGGLDIAFNNAGIEGVPAITHLCTTANWQRTLAVNLTGVWSCMRHEIPAMLQRGGGSIVNCASVAGLVGLTKTAALEYAQEGIRVNAVCPGVIDTEMVERFTGAQPDALAAITATEPVGRLGRPAEIGDAVVWLASRHSSFVTGQAIAVDGGYVAR
jgi:NAD(P)-dependent dehydrogenase (short-subunit alcohol dehydrogenase family)